MGYDCEALDELAESYRSADQVDLFNDRDPSNLERNGETRDNLSPGRAYDGEPNFDVEQRRERRSIALARRQKGCT